MDCACVYVDCDSYPDFFKQQNRKAVKQHKCSECKRQIEVGEKYEYTSGRWDGVLDTFKICNDCISIRKSFFCEGYSFGGMMELLADHICEARGEISGDCIKPLTYRARDIVCQMIENSWDWDDENETEDRI